MRCFHECNASTTTTSSQHSNSIWIWIHRICDYMPSQITRGGWIPASRSHPSASPPASSTCHPCFLKQLHQSLRIIGRGDVEAVYISALRVCGSVADFPPRPRCTLPRQPKTEFSALFPWKQKQQYRSHGKAEAISPTEERLKGTLAAASPETAAHM